MTATFIKEVELAENHFYSNINVKKLNDFAKLPTRGSEYAAGYDLYAATDKEIRIPPHSTNKIGTGLSFELPVGTFAAIFARSGIATKRHLRPANCVGICDSDYRGEYIIALHNDTDEMQSIEPGERIGQVIFIPYSQVNFIDTDVLSETARGADGFGGSGRF